MPCHVFSPASFPVQVHTQKQAGLRSSCRTPPNNPRLNLLSSRHYDLKHNDDIVSFFNDFSDHLAEEALWELSLKIKPRNITRRKTEREEKT